jgi:hypothetical protein
VTSTAYFKKQVLQFWDIPDENRWALYDDNGEMVAEDMMTDVIYQVSVMESRHKDLDALKPPSSKKMILYAGLKNSF